MCLANKILVGLIAFAALPLFFMAAWTLKTHKYWAELAQKHEQRIEQLQNDSRLLDEGTDKDGNFKQPGIRQVRLELHKLLLDRRRAWFHCDPKIKLGDDGTAEITVTIAQPTPHGIVAPDKKTVLYAFEETDAQGAICRRVFRLQRR